MNRKLLIATTALTLCLGFNVAQAQEDARELSRKADTTEEFRAYDYEYDRDEQCQGYEFGVKRLGFENPCNKAEPVAEPEPVAMPVVLKEYTVYFDFDSSAIRAQDESVLQQAAAGITKYNPTEVVVVGHADTHGDAKYNQALSAKRANAVSTQLTSMGVKNYVLGEEAKGEMEPAVPTGDNVKLQENRFVSIRFMGE